MMSCRQICILAVAAVMLVAGQNPLPTLTIQPTLFTVSGISAGGAMAQQYHVAYSKSVHGMASMAGPPYMCANGNVGIATTYCMMEPMFISVAELVGLTKLYAGSLQTIDPVSNMADDVVWLETGKLDTVVNSGVVEKGYQYYQAFVNASNVTLVKSLMAEHAWITDSYGNACSKLGEPYINNCNYDAAGEFLKLFIPNLLPAVSPVTANLMQFDQTPYIANGKAPASISFGKIGYVYIPSACSQNKTCKLHVVFHGCEQYYAKVGDVLPQNSGINGYAEANNIVVLYPQTTASQLMPYNPKGCFDWWGYTDSHYATKKGVQMQTITNMVKTLSNNVLPLQ